MVSTLTRFAVPVLADIIGSKWVMGVCFGLQTIPILILFVAGDSVALYFLFAVLFGIGMGGEMTAFPIINRQYYADAPTGTAYGWQMMGAGLGMALGPVAAGFLRDLTGSYVSSLWLVLRPQHPRRRRHNVPCPAPSGSSCPIGKKPSRLKPAATSPAPRPTAGAPAAAPAPGRTAPAVGGTGDGDGD